MNKKPLIIVETMSKQVFEDESVTMYNDGYKLANANAFTTNLSITTYTGFFVLDTEREHEVREFMEELKEHGE